MRESTVGLAKFLPSPVWTPPGRWADIPHGVAISLKEWSPCIDVTGNVVVSLIVFTLHQNVRSAASHDCRREASGQGHAFRTEHPAGRNCEDFEPESFVGVQAAGSGACAGTDWSPAGIEGRTSSKFFVSRNDHRISMSWTIRFGSRWSVACGGRKGSGLLAKWNLGLHSVSALTVPRGIRPPPNTSGPWASEMPIL